ncbi:MAG: 3-phosphoglycerate dehydrogenase [Lachnospiraceae bacterium]|nr:3-phosphoglycerate dehydrogenase [Lachnospiraceae bacterium]
MRKICCLNAIADCGLERLTDEYVKVENPAEAEGILVRSASMHEMELPSGLHAIARAGAGVNNIPLDKCAEKGIVVFNTPGANKNGVKELVMAGLLLASRDIVGGIEWCRSQKDEPDIEKKVEKGKKAFAGCEIKGKKLGVIGLGAIGCEVANAAVGLGMDVYGYDPFISVNAAWMLSRSVKHILDAEIIYRECDYITIHVPLLDSTKHMICKDSIDKMKDGVVVLNFARDLLVNDDDMEAALKVGKVKKYVTDFPNAKTASMEGTIAIPHLGASTEESEENCAMMAVDELRDYLENGNIHNSVNYPNCDMGICNDVARIAVHHANIPNMISQVTGVLAADGLNINHMTNKSRGQYAYMLLDLENSATEEAIRHLEKIQGVFKVRVVK